MALRSVREGDFVKFVHSEYSNVPALVVRVNSAASLNLCVFASTEAEMLDIGGMGVFCPAVEHDSQKAVGTWHQAGERK